MQTILDAIATISHLEWVSVAFGLAYVILAARENSWCWPCAFVGTGTAVVLFWDGLLPMEAALNAYYLAMAVYGWWQWRAGKSGGESTLRITSWGMQQHILCAVSIAALCLVSGYLLEQHTRAALPYLDSFTTWSAVITTWMVTRKILENWLYWLVINSASIYLYIDREFYLYAALFVIYLVIAVYGYWSWRKHFVQGYARAHANH